MDTSRLGWIRHTHSNTRKLITYKSGSEGQERWKNKQNGVCLKIDPRRKSSIPHRQKVCRSLRERRQSIPSAAAQNAIGAEPLDNKYSQIDATEDTNARPQLPTLYNSNLQYDHSRYDQKARELRKAFGRLVRINQAAAKDFPSHVQRVDWTGRQDENFRKSWRACNFCEISRLVFVTFNEKFAPPHGRRGRCTIVLACTAGTSTAKSPPRCSETSLRFSCEVIKLQIWGSERGSIF